MRSTSRVLSRRTGELSVVDFIREHLVESYLVLVGLTVLLALLAGFWPLSKSTMHDGEE